MILGAVIEGVFLHVSEVECLFFLTVTIVVTVIGKLIVCQDVVSLRQSLLQVNFATRGENTSEVRMNTDADMSSKCCAV